MRIPHGAIVLVLMAAGASPGAAGSIYLAPARATIGAVKLRPAEDTAKTAYDKMNRPGPVRSPDPYFTLKIGEAYVYRDAKDHSLAYYRPVLRLGAREGTPLAEGVGQLASELDGFRFRYYKFESGGSPKWADMQVVVIAERPAEITLEAVQSSWREVTRLLPLPLKLDAGTGVRMILPYPPRTVRFSRLEGTGGTADRRWYYFSTETQPSPADLLTDEDNDAVNETKARDFASLLTSDLADMPSFQPVLEVRGEYAGWAGSSPLQLRVVSPVSKVQITRKPTKTDVRPPPLIVPAPGLRTLPMRLSPEPVLPSARGSVTTELALAPVRRVLKPAARVQPVSPVLPPAAVLQPGAIRVLGRLSPRKDVDYTYSKSQGLIARIPITYPKGKTPDYDYYFLSDSGRFGGPYFTPSAVPERPQRAEPPEGFPGYWYESHWYGKRLVWPAPRRLSLKWNVESGLRPSCRFSLTSGEEGALTAHLTYDLYPDFSPRALSAAVADLAAKTGEEIELLPFTDVLDANQLVLESGGALLKDLMADNRVSIAKLSPQTINDAWFRLTVAMPITDWADFTLFMKLGELGTWDCGILTGAAEGVAEQASFELDGDLLDAMGGPVVAASESYDPETGGYTVSLENYGIAPLEIGGLQFLLRGAEETTLDVWFEHGVALPAMGSASSFDQAEGAGGSVGAQVAVSESAELKELMDSGDYQSLAVKLTSDMIRPATAPEAAGGADPDILFAFLRSLCYQYIGSSELIQVPVAPAELSQWLGYRSGRIVLRFQGFVYTSELDLSATNKVDIRRLPREGAYASAGRPGDADLLEYRAVFTTTEGEVAYLPAQPEGETQWLTGDISGVTLDMTQAR